MTRLLIRPTRPGRILPALVTLALWAIAPSAHAQSRTFELDADSGDWVKTSEPEPGSDAAIIAEARTLLANERPGRARKILKRWLKDNERSRNPYFPEALLLIGDAKVAQRDEFEALYDYERLILEYPESPEFVSAIERELEIATQYVNGLRRKAFGFRFEDASNIGEELLIRVQERLPGSRLAERAGIELADHYYREREMQLASDAYELFLANYPKSQHRRKALERRVYANIARFKGPEYDASGLRNAKALVQDYEAEFPIDAERTGLNSALIARLDESAATQMLDSADWYLRVNDDVAARYTLRRLIRQYPRTIAASAAFQIMESNGWAPPASAPPSGPDPDPDPGSVPDADTPTPADEDARE